MRQKTLMFLISLFLISTFSTFSLQFNSYEEEALYKKQGYQLQIEKAQHYIDYALLQGLEENDISVLRAYKVIQDSENAIKLTEDEIKEAIKKDQENEEAKKEQEKEDLLEDIKLSDENYKKLMSILEVLELEKIEEIPINFIKSMGLFNYTYELLKNEKVELPEQWILEEQRMFKEALFAELEEVWSLGYITTEDIIDVLEKNGIDPLECTFVNLREIIISTKE